MRVNKQKLWIILVFITIFREMRDSFLEKVYLSINVLI